MKVKLLKVFVLSLFFISLLTLSSMRSQEAVDYGKILGNWEIEVDADGEYYYLTLILKMSDGELEGAISESTGYFSDVPISDIEYDGTNLRFEFTAPTPPDGYERVVRTEFEVGDNTLEGTMNLDDLGVSALATGKREDK
jgi:hypothetical protein